MVRTGSSNANSAFDCFRSVWCFSIYYSPFTIYQKESPALNNAGLSSNPFRLVLRERLAELFSGLFYVAASRLNSPRLLQAIETSHYRSVKPLDNVLSRSISGNEIGD